MLGNCQISSLGLLIGLLILIILWPVEKKKKEANSGPRLCSGSNVLQMSKHPFICLQGRVELHEDSRFLTSDHSCYEHNSLFARKK